MADQHTQDSGSVDMTEITVEREREWESFTQLVTWGVGITVLVLIGLLFFVA